MVSKCRRRRASFRAVPVHELRHDAAPGGGDDHDLVIGRRQGLVEQGGEKAVEIRRVIVGGDEKADLGHRDRGMSTALAV
jgi:hypothetical protein